MLFTELIWIVLWIWLKCASVYWNCRYDHKLFSGLIWQHRVIGGNCSVFTNCVINCNGRASSFEEGRQRLQRYARRLQNLGCQVRLRDAKILTVSASHTLSGGLDLHRLTQERAFLYVPEIFPAVNFKLEGINFCCFHTGKVVIMGIRHPTRLNDIIYSTLIELELYIHKK